MSRTKKFVSVPFSHRIQRCLRHAILQSVTLSTYSERKILARFSSYPHIGIEFSNIPDTQHSASHNSHYLYNFSIAQEARDAFFEHRRNEK